MSAHWHVERLDGFAVLSYGRGVPQAIPIAAMAELCELVGGLAAGTPVRPLVLDLGILHADLGEVLELAHGRPIADFAPWVAAIGAIERYPLPTVACVARRATAGGCELALACDLRVSAPDAQLGLLETRLGIIPGAGGTQRLTRLVGPGHAARLVFDGGPVSGREAARIGLVQVLAADPLAEATRLARRYAERSEAVMAAAKQALRAATELPLAEGLRAEGRALLSVLGEPVATERLTAWIGGDEDLSPS